MLKSIMVPSANFKYEENKTLCLISYRHADCELKIRFGDLNTFHIDKPSIVHYIIFLFEKYTCIIIYCFPTLHFR